MLKDGVLLRPFFVWLSTLPQAAFSPRYGLEQ